jgi:hypothetical protein
MLSHLVVVLIVCCIIVCHGQRNAEEEAICAPFLTSPNSSPLVEGLQRNLKYDEDAEFSCELVLQDVQLPPQIRLTIHEGLYYLAVRHIQMGLHRERTAARHAKHLAAMVPRNFNFQYYLGMWSIHHEVEDPEVAVKSLYECLYGAASEDVTATHKSRYHARRDYITALFAVDRKEEAMVEIQKLLELHPFDFEVAFLWKTYNSHNSTASNSGASKEVDELQSVISQLTSDHTVSIPDYDQCKAEVASNLHVISIHHMVTPQEFNRLLEVRIPMKISVETVKAISDALHWDIYNKWFLPGTKDVNLQYFKENIAEDEEVLVESTRFAHCDHDPKVDSTASTPADYNRPCVAFGLSLGAHRRNYLFHKLVDQNFQNLESGESFYLNVQNAGSGEAPYRPPLHHLKNDIPITANDTFLRLVRDNITDINLWLSETRLQSSVSPHPHRRPTASRLHRDAQDNLYIVLQGQKNFSIWHPCSYRDMKTISPSYHVNADGLPTQFNVNAFKTYVRAYINEQLAASEDPHVDTAQNITSQQDMDSRLHAQKDLLREEIVNKLHPLLQRLVADSEDNIVYDTINLHFSQMSSHDGASSLPLPTSIVSVEPGDMLYLPTGWFHEVTSMPGRQVALNIWWKPPHWESARRDEEKAQQHLFHGLLNHFQEINAKGKSQSVDTHTEL